VGYFIKNFDRCFHLKIVPQAELGASRFIQCFQWLMAMKYSQNLGKKNPDAIKHRGILVGVGGIMRLCAV
tara:strand:+ start:661 stop:870 length:210 start_codon:yes stop_codon:yes gene_type:complete